MTTRSSDPRGRARPRSARDRCWPRAAHPARAAATARAMAAPSANAVSRVCWPITSGTIGTPGNRCATNGICISSECSRPCAAGRSTMCGDSAAIAAARSPSTRHRTERRLPGALGPDRDAAKRHEVRGPDQHDGADTAAAARRCRRTRRPDPNTSVPRAARRSRAAAAAGRSTCARPR